MANTITVTKILEGPKTAIFQVFLKSDGASGELVNQVLIDPAVTLAPAMAQTAGLTVTRVWSTTVGFDALLNFDATAPQPIWELSRTLGPDCIDFREVGGLKDRSTTGSTGKITISTTGFTVATSQGTILIQIRKN